MLNRTECDLSFDSTKLDFEALHKTANLAFGLAWRETQRLVSEIHNCNLYKDTVKPVSVTDRLAQVTENLAYIAEVLSTIIGAMTRSELIIVNKPEVEQE